MLFLLAIIGIFKVREIFMEFFSAFDEMLSRAGFKEIGNRATTLGCSDEYVRRIFKHHQVPSDELMSAWFW